MYFVKPAEAHLETNCQALKRTCVFSCVMCALLARKMNQSLKNFIQMRKIKKIGFTAVIKNERMNVTGRKRKIKTNIKREKR